jgi:alpha-galactosidase
MRQKIQFLQMWGIVAALIGASMPSAAIAPSAPATEAAAADIWIDSLDLATFSQRRGTPKAGKAVGGGPLSLAGAVHAHGIGTRSISEFVIALHGNARRFRATVGLDDTALAGKREGTVRFQLWADDRLVADSGVLGVADPPRPIEADLTGAATLTMRLDDGGDTSNGDLADWGSARITLADPAGPRPTPWRAPPAGMPAIAPPTRTLALHGPLLVGTTPGKPFLYRIPATGGSALRFSAAGLPRGLMLDPASGVLSGTVSTAGTYDLRLTASLAGRRVTRPLRIVAGRGKLAQTPPMGWNSWNVWGTAVDDAKVRAAADALVSSGLAAHGYDTVVIDDAWAGQRDARGEIQPNARFPDMKALTDHAHALGLRIGIYSAPGPKTCGGYAGSYGHEAQDAATFARWGFDFLKYDWCSYDDVAPDHSLPELQKPYRLMADALAAGPRDIVFSLCQYGYGDVWEWGAAIGGNLWRTTGDLLDMWANLDSVGFRQAGRERFAGRGHWNDTDMLVVGPVGWGPNLPSIAAHPRRAAPPHHLMGDAGGTALRRRRPDAARSVHARLAHQ